MMAQPRFKCLNATRRVARGSLGVREFSRSSIARAEDEFPRRPSAALDLLSTLTSSSRSPATAGILAATDSPAYASPSKSTNRELPNTAPVRLQRRTGSLSPNAPIKGSSERLIRLMGQNNRRASQPPGNNPRAGGATSDQLEENRTANSLSRQITRRWKAGDVYAPKDLSSVEMAKWKNRGRPERDVFDVLKFDPLVHYQNFSIMSEYMTPMGRIKHGNETGLRPVNQRKIARAIRRSIGMGMMPSVHRHPEIMYKNEVRSQILSPNTRGPV